MKRWFPLILLLFFMIVAYLTGLSDIISFETLKVKREELIAFVRDYPIASPLWYMLLYAVSVALSLPVGLVLSLLGGFLFPQPFSTLFVVIGATSGAAALFMIAKTALGNELKQSARPFLKKMQAGFEKNAASYLLFLRLIPIFPFWLVNLAPALLGVPFKTFVWTTFVGIIPGAFVFTQAGVGLGAILDAGDKPTLDTIFNLQIKIALAALALFALLPLLYRKFKKS